MGAKILQADKTFFGKSREKGSVLTDEELGFMTSTLIASLISQGVIEMEGAGNGGSGGLTVADHEKIDRLQASADRTNDLLAKLVETVGKLKVGKAKA